MGALYGKAHATSAAVTLAYQGFLERMDRRLPVRRAPVPMQPPRTQAALLECMEERQVTHDGTPYELPRSFTMFATQSPIDLKAPIRCRKPSWTGFY